MDSQSESLRSDVFTSFHELGKAHPQLEDAQMLVGSSEAVASLKRKTVRRSVDDEWISRIEYSLPYLDNVIRQPFRAIEDVEDVVPVELSKRISEKSVRHLSQHTNLIRKVEGDTVTPSKILNIYHEETLVTYENRFTNTLIRRLFAFVDRRYHIMLAHVGTEQEYALRYRTEFEHEEQAAGKSTVNFELKLEMNAPQVNDITEKDIIRNDRYHDQVKRVDRIYHTLLSYLNSAFCKQLGKNMVRPPVIRTNAILKNKNLRVCLDLWEYIQSFQKAGYTISEEEFREVPSDDYIRDFYQSVALQYVQFYNNVMQDAGSSRLLSQHQQGEIAPDFESNELENEDEDYNIYDTQYRKMVPVSRLINNRKKLSEDEKRIRSAIDLALEADEAIAEIRAARALERKRLEEEAERLRKEEEAERERIAAEDAERRRKAEEARIRHRREEARRRILEAEIRAQLAVDAADRWEEYLQEKKRQAALAEHRRQIAAAEAKRRIREAGVRAKLAKLAADRWQAWEAELRRRAEEKAEQERLAREEKERWKQEMVQCRLIQTQVQHHLAEEAAAKWVIIEQTRERLAHEALMRQLAEQERQRLLAEMAEQRRKAEEEQKKLFAEMAEQRRKAQEEQARILDQLAEQKKQLELARKQQAEEEARMRAAAEENRRQSAAERARRLAAAEEARKQKEAEEARRKAADAARRQKAAEEARRQAAEAEARHRKEIEEVLKAQEDWETEQQQIQENLDRMYYHTREDYLVLPRQRRREILTGLRKIQKYEREIQAEQQHPTGRQIPVPHVDDEWDELRRWERAVHRRWKA